MTSDDRGRSLADEAARWVPPWERAVPEPRTEAVPEAAGEKAVEALIEEEGPIEESTEEVVEEAVDGAAGHFGGETTEPPAERAATDGQPFDAGLFVPLDLDLDPDAATNPSVPEDPADLVDTPVPVELVEPVEPAGPIEAVEFASLVETVESVESGELGEPGETGESGETTPGEAAPAVLALAGDEELCGALEAILLVVEEPVSEVNLAEVLEQPTERITELLTMLAKEYAATGRGFDLRRAAGGWRLYTRPEYASYVERFVLDGQRLRLTQAALETLAVIAYRQPVTRSRVSAIRGVNCDGVIRTLVSRGLVEECGTEPESGAFLYRTTTLFLEKLGLDSVDELPPLAPFLPDDVDEIADAPR